MDVVVRPWTEGDAEALEAAVEESRAHLRPWMAWVATGGVDAGSRRGWIREQNEAEAAGGDRVRGAFVGDAGGGAGGLHRRIGPGALAGGCGVHAAWTRRGVARAGFTSVGERARAPVAPADGPTERIWRLTRDQYRKRI